MNRSLKRNNSYTIKKEERRNSFLTNMFNLNNAQNYQILNQSQSSLQNQSQKIKSQNPSQASVSQKQSETKSRHSRPYSCNNLDEDLEEELRQQLLDQENEDNFFNKNKYYTQRNHQSDFEQRNEDKDLENLSDDELYPEKHDYEDDKKKYSNKTTIQSVLRLTNSGMQCAVVFLPYFSSQFGILFTIIILIIVFFMSIFSTVLLLKIKNISLRSNYTSIMSTIFGYNSEYFIRFFIAMTKLGYMIFTIGVISINLQTVSCLIKYFQETCPDKNTSYFLKYPFFTIILCIISFPFLFQPKIRSFKYVSYMRWIAMLTLAFVIIVTFIIDIIEDTLTEYTLNFYLPSKFSFQNAFSSLPLMVMVFNYHPSMFSIYKRMRDVSDKKMIIATVYGNTSISIMYGFIGLMGYMTQGDMYSEDFIANINTHTISNSKSIAATILLILFSLALLCQIPSYFYQVKFYLYSILRLHKLLKIRKEEYDDYTKNKNNTFQHQLKALQILKIPIFQLKSKKISFLISLILIIIVAILAYIQTSYLQFSTFLGAIFANLNSFFFPSLMYIKVSKSRVSLKIAAWIILTLSLAILFLSILGIILKIQNTFIDNE